MDFIRTQNFKGKLNFYSDANNDDKISINLSISTNHILEHDLISEVESALSKLLIKNYINQDIYEARQEACKQEEENKKLIDKQNKMFMKKKTEELKRRTKEAQLFNAKKEKLLSKYK